MTFSKAAATHSFPCLVFGHSYSAFLRFNANNELHPQLLLFVILTCMDQVAAGIHAWLHWLIRLESQELHLFTSHLLVASHAAWIYNSTVLDIDHLILIDDEILAFKSEFPIWMLKRRRLLLDPIT